MKKRFLCVLLVLTLCMGLLPMTVCAAPIMLNHVDITVELPKGDDPFDQGFIPTITSFTGDGGIDLLATGAGILNAYWVGDTGIEEEIYPTFRAGTTYHVSFKLIFNTDAGYCANYVMSQYGEYIVGPETFSATVNGIPATITRNNPPYHPTLEVSLKLEGEALSEEEKVEITEEDNMHREVRRLLKDSCTWAEASEFDTENYPEKLLIMDAVDDFGYNGGLAKQEKALLDEDLTTVIFDADYAAMAAWWIPSRKSLREVWVGDGVDILKFYHTMTEEAEPMDSSQYPFNRTDGTLLISESAANTLKTEVGSGWYPTPAFTIKVYSGNDVYAAQKAGASAATDFCTNHEYSVQIPSIDRVYTFDTCKTAHLYYYSCRICGKCEYNPNHVDYDQKMSKAELETYKMTVGLNKQYDTELPNDSAYIGVNVAGQHVWWLSCNTCGKSYKYDNTYVTEKAFKAANFPMMNFDEYKTAMTDSLKQREEQILNSTMVMPQTFTLSRKSNVNMSEWAQSDINFALNDNLIDDAVLGWDYTQNISRQQFCSVAVKLAEELIGHDIAPADGSTFTDTNDTYVLKAYAAGITSGTSDTTFDPNGTLTRQQMGTFLYRALNYVEQNSDYKYTNYDSKLGNYTDSWSVQSWAEDAMAFMNALDLIKGNTDTTLNPDGLCTIEQAVAVADRCVYAHQLGWYQVAPHKFSYNSDKGTWGGHDHTYLTKSCRFLEGKYIWVTGRRYNLKYTFDIAGKSVEEGQLPFWNAYTGQIMGIDYQDVIPVRD